MQLEQECIACRGTGCHTEWGPPGQKRGHVYCPRKGETIVFRVEGGCQYCDGTGYELTNFGAEIMALVRRHLNAKPTPIPPIEITINPSPQQEVP